LVKTPKINFLNACPRNVNSSWECVLTRCQDAGKGHGERRGEEEVGEVGRGGERWVRWGEVGRGGKRWGEVGRGGVHAEVRRDKANDDLAKVDRSSTRGVRGYH